MATVCNASSVVRGLLRALVEGVAAGCVSAIVLMLAVRVFA